MPQNEYVAELGLGLSHKDSASNSCYDFADDDIEHGVDADTLNAKQKILKKEDEDISEASKNLKGKSPSKIDQTSVQTVECSKESESKVKESKKKPSIKLHSNVRMTRSKMANINAKTNTVKGETIEVDLEYDTTQITNTTVKGKKKLAKMANCYVKIEPVKCITTNQIRNIQLEKADHDQSVKHSTSSNSKGDETEHITTASVLPVVEACVSPDTEKDLNLIGIESKLATKTNLDSSDVKIDEVAPGINADVVPVSLQPISVSLKIETGGSPDVKSDIILPGTEAKLVPLPTNTNIATDIVRVGIETGLMASVIETRNSPGIETDLVPPGTETQLVPLTTNTNIKTDIVRSDIETDLSPVDLKTASISPEIETSISQDMETDLVPPVTEAKLVDLRTNANIKTDIVRPGIETDLSHVNLKRASISPKIETSSSQDMETYLVPPGTEAKLVDVGINAYIKACLVEGLKTASVSTKIKANGLPDMEKEAKLVDVATITNIKTKVVPPGIETDLVSAGLKSAPVSSKTETSSLLDMETDLVPPGTEAKLLDLATITNIKTEIVPPGIETELVSVGLKTAPVSVKIETSSSLDMETDVVPPGTEEKLLDLATITNIKTEIVPPGIETDLVSAGLKTAPVSSEIETSSSLDMETDLVQPGTEAKLVLATNTNIKTGTVSDHVKTDLVPPGTEVDLVQPHSVTVLDSTDTKMMITHTEHTENHENVSQNEEISKNDRSSQILKLVGTGLVPPGTETEIGVKTLEQLTAQQDKHVTSDTKPSTLKEKTLGDHNTKGNRSPNHSSSDSKQFRNKSRSPHKTSKKQDKNPVTNVSTTDQKKAQSPHDDKHHSASGKNRSGSCERNRKRSRSRSPRKTRPDNKNSSDRCSSCKNYSCSCRGNWRRDRSRSPRKAQNSENNERKTVGNISKSANEKPEGHQYLTKSMSSNQANSQLLVDGKPCNSCENNTCTSPCNDNQISKKEKDDNNSDMKTTASNQKKSKSPSQEKHLSTSSKSNSIRNKRHRSRSRSRSPRRKRPRRSKSRSPYVDKFRREENRRRTRSRSRSRSPYGSRSRQRRSRSRSSERRSRHRSPRRHSPRRRRGDSSSSSDSDRSSKYTKRRYPTHHRSPGFLENLIRKLNEEMTSDKKTYLTEVYKKLNEPSKEAQAPAAVEPNQFPTAYPSYIYGSRLLPFQVSAAGTNASVAVSAGSQPPISTPAIVPLPTNILPSISSGGPAVPVYTQPQDYKPSPVSSVGPVPQPVPAPQIIVPTPAAVPKNPLLSLLNTKRMLAAVKQPSKKLSPSVSTSRFTFTWTPAVTSVPTVTANQPNKFVRLPNALNQGGGSLPTPDSIFSSTGVISLPGVLPVQTFPLLSESFIKSKQLENNTNNNKQLDDCNKNVVTNSAIIAKKPAVLSICEAALNVWTGVPTLGGRFFRKTETSEENTIFKKIQTINFSYTSTPKKITNLDTQGKLAKIVTELSLDDGQKHVGILEKLSASIALMASRLKGSQANMPGQQQPPNIVAGPIPSNKLVPPVTTALKTATHVGFTNQKNIQQSNLPTLQTPPTTGKINQKYVSQSNTSNKFLGSSAAVPSPLTKFQLLGQQSEKPAVQKPSVANSTNNLFQGVTTMSKPGTVGLKTQQKMQQPCKPTVQQPQVKLSIANVNQKFVPQTMAKKNQNESQGNKNIPQGKAGPMQTRKTWGPPLATKAPESKKQAESQFVSKRQKNAMGKAPLPPPVHLARVFISKGMQTTSTATYDVGTQVSDADWQVYRKSKNYSSSSRVCEELGQPVDEDHNSYNKRERMVTPPPPPDISSKSSTQYFADDDDYTSYQYSNDCIEIDCSSDEGLQQNVDNEHQENDRYSEYDSGPTLERSNVSFRSATEYDRALEYTASQQNVGVYSRQSGYDPPWRRETGSKGGGYSKQSGW